ncbi:sensor histidine kinase [Azospirillum agricola]|uniref:sensor histidine kinase n=1 Tax=Azospirillum agricola TaxID=1720247 RepID=UPI000A0F1B87|nr:histidine kinase [Azospirillum agricola]SMH34854.1 Histidine kinase-, DNA gyrase B-, and HSP90-like ATPase [Azospirillum lipoferum]
MTNVTFGGGGGVGESVGETGAGPLLRSVDPRWRLAAAIGWSIALVSLAVALFVGFWTMREARQALEREIGQLYATHAQRLIDTIDTNLAGRREWVAASATLIGVREGGLAGPDADRALADLKGALAEIEWAGIIDLNGTVVAGTGGVLVGQSVVLRPWYTGAFLGPYIGDTHRELLLDRLLPPLRNGEPRRFVELSAPVLDRAGSIRGVLAVTLGWSWIEALQRGTLATLKDRPGAEVLLLGIDGTVLFGSRQTPRGTRIDLSAHPFGTSHSVEGGLLSGIARSSGFADFPGLGWSVMVREPVATAFRTADRASVSIFTAIALGGLFATLLSVLVASRIMRRLTAMAEAADDLRTGRKTGFEGPTGRDEAGRIGRSIASLVGTLQQANAELSASNERLDARVEERTREIERLSHETRAAAIVRERLRISRDLHDTVAHTLLGLLTQIRLIRKLVEVDPSRLPEEIRRADEAAQEGLAHARGAVSQLRYSPVRDDGFGPALRRLVCQIQDRSAARLSLAVDGGAEGMTGQAAETLYRMIEEALRNAVRHADATSVAVSVALVEGGDGAAAFQASVRDDGVGFDPTADQANHFGLLGLREQAELIGAALTLDSAPGRGTTVILRWPWAS